MFWRLDRTYLDKAVNTVGTFFPAFKRVGFTVPKARGGIETTGKDRLLRGLSCRMIQYAKPLPCAGAFQELFNKWYGVVACWDVEVDSLHEVFSVLLMPGRNQDLHLGEQGLALLFEGGISEL